METSSAPDGQTVGHSIDPPISCSEMFRDGLLRVLDGIMFQILGLTVLILVIADGAFFFFLLVGWHTMCRPRTDCDPRNHWYNIAVQILTGLFSYTAVVSMPWRCTNAIHVFGWGFPYRKNEVGHDLYGLSSNDIWYHIPLGKRRGIIIFLLLNCLTQFANQYTRILYSSFDAQNTSPGNIWTGIFFLCSMLCAGIAGVWLAYEDSKVRKISPPGRFPPGLMQIIGKQCRRCRQRSGDVTAHEENSESIPAKDEIEEIEERSSDAFDPTRNLSHCDLMATDRGAMRLFAM